MPTYDSSPDKDFYGAIWLALNGTVTDGVRTVPMWTSTPAHGTYPYFQIGNFVIHPIFTLGDDVYRILASIYTFSADANDASNLEMQHQIIAILTDVNFTVTGWNCERGLLLLQQSKCDHSDPKYWRGDLQFEFILSR